MKNRKAKTRLNLETLIPNNQKYLFLDKKPVTSEDYDNILNALNCDNAEPRAVAAYLTCRSVHNDDVINIGDINLYLNHWIDSDINAAIFDLVDRGYFKEVSYSKSKNTNNFNSCIVADNKLFNNITTKNEILSTNTSPIAVGVYMACIEYNEDECVDEEMLWNERGIEELEKLGYLVDTNRYYELDGREIKIYKFIESILNKERIIQ